MRVIPQPQTPYDPEPEYGLLTWHGTLEAGMGGAHTEAGLAALDNVLLRIGSLFYASFDGIYYSMPNFSQTTI
jgi:hypothetical protein